MTQQAMAAPAQPQPTPTDKDKLGPLVHEELPREVKRILEQEASLEQLKMEIARTVLPMVHDLSREVLKFRNWAAFAHEQHADQLDDHEQRLTMVEAVSLGGDSQLTPEDAELFSNCIDAAGELAEQNMKTTTDSAGRALLQKIVDQAKEAKERIEEIEMIIDDDDDDEDQEDGAEEVVPNVPPAVASGAGS